MVFVTSNRGIPQPRPAPEVTEGDGAAHQPQAAQMLARQTSDSGVWASEYLECCITGMDEYVNLILDDADKILYKTNSWAGSC